MAEGHQSAVRFGEGYALRYLSPADFHSLSIFQAVNGLIVAKEAESPESSQGWVMKSRTDVADRA